MYPLCVMYRQRTGRWPSVHSQTCPYSFRHHSNLFVVMPQTTCVRFLSCTPEFLTTHLHPYSRTDVLLHQDVPTNAQVDTARLVMQDLRTRPRFGMMMGSGKTSVITCYVSLSLTTPTLRAAKHILSIVLPEGLVKQSACLFALS
jgi:hypothetical protein